MPAASYDITIEQGATFTLSLIWRDNLGVPIDISGYTARMQVRSSHKSDTKLLDFTTENGAITLGGVAGTIVVTGLATLTDDVPARPAVYDLELVSPGGVVTRLIEGYATVTPEVTRP